MEAKAGHYIPLAVAVVLMASTVSVQGQKPDPPGPRRFDVVRAGGASIGASIRELTAAELKASGGVYVESVEPDGPASKAGLQAADIITRFDSEPVRSVRQFVRLVQEAAPGRTVRASILRAGSSREVSVTPESGFQSAVMIDANRLRLDMAELQERLRQIPFDIDVRWQGAMSRARLGVSVEVLTSQLAEYFGAKDGVLVASVAADSPASRAGLKAGDVIVSVNGQTVASTADLVRQLRSANAETDVTIGIVRDKKETSVKARLEPAATRRPPRQIRPVRATPA